MAVAPRSKPLIRVPSSDGIDVALHELAGDDVLPTLLISHATGFHAHCYEAIAASLADRFHSVGLDYRGHGATDLDPGWATDWSRFGDDALAAARRLAVPIVGFGHSMGGAALLMAAHREPTLFERLVLFEPIAHPAAPAGASEQEIDANPMVQGALRRRRTFASFEAAYDNYRAKPPMSVMTPPVLRNYVEYGFRPTVDADGAPAVTLRCAPEVEAGIFATARNNGVWGLLTEIETPCVVIAGRVETSEPSFQTRSIAERLPHAQYVQLDHQTHFGPFSHPTEVAELIAA
ncbi:MAG: alpha/beta hydrolase [Ilumatobacteraceae bacterium]|nr:alpha/beta hydrolase [Ilumatobacteraceae bacterium]